MLTDVTDETLKPIAATPPKSADNTIPIGRQADILAALLASLGAIFSVLGALWFFVGFVENDKRPEHLISALALTLILFAFAIIPFALTAGFARHAYQKGTKRAHLLWTLLLMLPWVILGTLAISHTPLPIWCGLIMTSFAALLSLWALASLVLDWNVKAGEILETDETDTELSRKYETSEILK